MHKGNDARYAQRDILKRKTDVVLDEAKSLTLARLALPHFGFDPETVKLQFIKMRENTVFRADTPQGPIALRLHRPGYRTEQEVAAESEFIGILADRGFPVVRLVPALDGGFTATVSHGGTEVVVDAQRWLEGSRELGSSEGDDHEGHLEPAHFEEMGKIAARMHHLAQELSGVKRFARAPWDAEGMVGSRALWGDALTVSGLTDESKEQLARTREIMLRALEHYGSDPAVYGVIHADFTAENLLVSGDELVVIDFDDFGEGWYLFDLATALFFVQTHVSYAAFRTALLRGYRTERTLSEADERMLDLLLVARGFTYLGWAATRPETETAAFLVAEIVPLVVELAAALEAAGAPQPADSDPA